MQTPPACQYLTATMSSWKLTATTKELICLHLLIQLTFTSIDHLGEKRILVT